MISEKENVNDLFGDFLAVIEKLRSPDGCPWDREQTPASMRGHLIEESYETIEAIDDNDAPHVREELGDVLLLVTMITQMFSENGDFDMAEVIREISAKLIRRHPHVFGDEKASNAEEVLKTWERVKTDIEGRKPADSVIDGIPGSLPPLERAYKIQKKAAKNGFDWPDSQGPRTKITEELLELEEAHEAGNQDKIEEELGDVLFSVVNLARHVGVDPALALRRTNAKFSDRFRHVEKHMKEDGMEMAPGNLASMDNYWDRAKEILG